MIYGAAKKIRGFPSGSVVQNPPAIQESQEPQFQSLGWKIPWRHDNPLQYFCLENRMDKAWQTTVHRVPELDKTKVTYTHKHKKDETNTGPQ